MIENKTMKIEKLADQPIYRKETNEKNEQPNGYSFSLAPPTGLEPVTSWLTVMRSTDWAMEEYINVGVFLFSQAASSQLSSALLSLTSVFGMGTGGPSASSTPTIYYLYFLFRVLVTRARIELALPPWEGGVLTAWPTGQFSSARAGCPAPTFSLVRHQGFEPGTPWLRVRCSTNWANGAYCALHLQNWIKNF